MDLLEQCLKLNEAGKYQELIDLVEAVPVKERSAKVVSELAKAYISIADGGMSYLYQKAIDLLEPLWEELADDHCWNYRLATAYYYLGQEYFALPYYERALEARPGDEDTQENIDDCRQRLALPRFNADFSERTKLAWDAFAKIESDLRAVMDTKDHGTHVQELMDECSKALKLAISDPSFELGKEGEKYALILSADGGLPSLFPLVYLRDHAPKSLLKHWKIFVGRQKNKDIELRSGDISVGADDVQMWVEQNGAKQLDIELYCPKLKDTLAEDEDKAWWALSVLIDQSVGEVSAIANISELEVLSEPKNEPSTSLSKLPEIMQEHGMTLWHDASEYLENAYKSYQLEPDDSDEDLRADVYIGSTRLLSLINEYMIGASECINDYHKDGIVAGFIAYPLDGFTGENRGEEILKFRDDMRAFIEKNATSDAVTFLGGATGIGYGYFDFIAWDLYAVLQAASEFCSQTELPFATFHTFRRDVSGIQIWNKDDEAEVHEETGSLLSVEDINTLESFVDDTSGYYGKMLSYLDRFVEKGVQERRFSVRQAQQDLHIALWYAFACINLDEYICYYRAVEWMKHSEINASGCGKWYYRYSCALMNIGMLQEALDYAEKGSVEEPDYPWVWLQVGKLRSHFGNKEGALEAVAHGLELVPGDHEFKTLKREIESGATIEQMLYHWINPEEDFKLQDGLLPEDADNKQRGIACVNIDPEGFKRFWDVFGPEPEEYKSVMPYVAFNYAFNDGSVELVFRMNKAGMSKLKSSWLKELKSSIECGKWTERESSDGRKGVLKSIIVGLDYSINLLFKIKDGEGLFKLKVSADGTEEEDGIWDPNNDSEPEMYSEEEMAAVDTHIADHFGPIDKVFHEIVSPDIHVDICLIPPTEDRDYYSLVTMGMGAHKMNVPDELSEYKLERAELCIALPADWKLDEESMSDENWYWPIRLLKTLARLPQAVNSWLGFGHTMDSQSPFAKCTMMSGSLLIGPHCGDDDAATMELPNGDQVNFYQVIPLYKEEMDYKVEHGTDALLEKMAGISFIVKNDRRCCIDDGDDRIGY